MAGGNDGRASHRAALQRERRDLAGHPAALRSYVVRARELARPRPCLRCLVVAFCRVPLPAEPPAHGLSGGASQGARKALRVLGTAGQQPQDHRQIYPASYLAGPLVSRLFALDSQVRLEALDLARWPSAGRAGRLPMRHCACGPLAAHMEGDVLLRHFLFRSSRAYRASGADTGRALPLSAFDRLSWMRGCRDLRAWAPAFAKLARKPAGCLDRDGCRVPGACHADLRPQLRLAR